MHRCLIMIAVAALATTNALAASSKGSVLTETARNQNNFVMKLELLNFVNGAWSGDANFTISECPQTSCFRLSGSLKIVSSPQSEVVDYEGFYPVPGIPCVVRFEEAPHRGMDSGDYRLTLISTDKAGIGCSSLPAGLAGLYEQAVKGP